MVVHREADEVVEQGEEVCEFHSILFWSRATLIYCVIVGGGPRGRGGRGGMGGMGGGRGHGGPRR